jgi:hypothetical protein
LFSVAAAWNSVREWTYSGKIRLVLNSNPVDKAGNAGGVALALALIRVLLPLVFPETRKLELTVEAGGEREGSNSLGSSSAWGRRVSDFLLCDSVEDRMD